MSNTELTETLDAPVIEISKAPPLAFVPDKNWNRERESFYRMLPELLKLHKGQFVAIFNGSVAGVGDNFIAVATDIYGRLGRVPAYIGLVAEQPVRLVRIPSFRVLAAGKAGEH